MANLQTARSWKSLLTFESLSAVEAAGKLDGDVLPLGRPVLIAPRSSVKAPVFILDPRSWVHVYLQLTQLVKRAVALGTLAAGEQLPTVKVLVLELIINANTVARAIANSIAASRSSRQARGAARSSAAETPRHESPVTVVAAFDEAMRRAHVRHVGTDISARFDRALERWFLAERGELVNVPLAIDDLTKGYGRFKAAAILAKEMNRSAYA